MPIIEAFYKGVPVLAYASTAVPATMDGGGVLYDTTDPFEIARLMEAVLDDPALEEAVLQSQDAALARLLARDFAGTLLRFVDEVIARPAAARAGRRVGLLGRSSSSSNGSRSCGSSGRRCFRRCRLRLRLRDRRIRDQGSGTHRSAGDNPKP